MSKKKFKEPKKAYNGFVYIIKIHIDPIVIFKIGTTNRTAETRMLEIAGELNRVLGYIPKMVLVRKKQTKDNYKVEADVLKQTEKYRYILACNGEISGESELRKMEEIQLINLYESCLIKDYPADQEFKVEL